ncbi:hypothetical protein [Sporosarcina sp. G11-34]|uniref:hypothetical protein n=1 Tax=Sporosarcina sp. G11-34 TaxID=2849605 RepID=UPI0022A902FE|nr:hypothetical protein [Sporosarcina sp. G11-34]MCZ2259704.1 hypothetical protein [Sporosarcina sp. G11-34]
MFHSWKNILLIMLSTLFLTACGQSLEDRTAKGLKSAEEAFYANNKAGTEEFDGVKLYKPMGFTIKEDSDAQNILFNKNDDTFILFINPNEEANSRLFYDLLIEDETKETVAIETFIENRTFGFVAVVESGNNQVELIVSVGGAKITTITKEKNIDTHLRMMMEIVRSISKQE